MLGQLNNQQMTDLLTKQVTGRLGCRDGNGVYIVPVNYVFRKEAIYAHSGPGKKLELMKLNPNVCFEVEEISSINRWETVVIKGVFEEVTDLQEAQQAMQALIHRIMPLTTSADGHPSHGITAKETDVGTQIALTVYRIVISEMTGRFES